VAEDQLEKTVKELITQITSQSGAVLTMAKKAILDGMGMSLRDGLRNSMNIFLNGSTAWKILKACALLKAQATVKNR
jgi:enoyl-CoA hydratase/carnithine racemase